MYSTYTHTPTPTHTEPHTFILTNFEKKENQLNMIQ